MLAELVEAHPVPFDKLRVQSCALRAQDRCVPPEHRCAVADECESESEYVRKYGLLWTAWIPAWKSADRWLSSCPSPLGQYRDRDKGAEKWNRSLRAPRTAGPR